MAFRETDPDKIKIAVDRAKHKVDEHDKSDESSYYLDEPPGDLLDLEDDCCDCDRDCCNCQDRRCGRYSKRDPLHS